MVHESRGTGVVLPCIVKPWNQQLKAYKKLKALLYRLEEETGKRKEYFIFLYALKDVGNNDILSTLFRSINISYQD